MHRSSRRQSKEAQATGTGSPSETNVGLKHLVGLAWGQVELGWLVGLGWVRLVGHRLLVGRFFGWLGSLRPHPSSTKPTTALSPGQRCAGGAAKVPNLPVATRQGVRQTSAGSAWFLSGYTQGIFLDDMMMTMVSKCG